jgi:DNA polymerase
LARLQKLFGEPGLKPIGGAGCLDGPEVVFIFMNPTARNTSARAGWKGLRAPWIGTKNIWSLFNGIGVLSEVSLRQIQENNIWTPEFALGIYQEVARNKAYITNLAKCTQADARPLKNEIFREYLEIMRKEITLLNPKKIITFGNQVSSMILAKPVSVSQYAGRQKETLEISGRNFDIYPVYYPVGQGRRNMPLAIKRIKAIINVSNKL